MKNFLLNNIVVINGSVMDLNFVLEYYREIFFSSIVVGWGLTLIFLIGLTLLLLASFVFGIYGLGVISDVLLGFNFLKSITKALEKMELEAVGLFISSFILPGVASYMGAHYLKEKTDVVLQVEVNHEYDVKIKESGTLILLKKVLVEKKKLETSTVNGMEIEKEVLEKTEKDHQYILKIKCGKLSFDECLIKTRENLGAITAGANGFSQQVVQF